MDDPGGIDIATVDSTDVDTVTPTHKEGFTYQSLPTGPFDVFAIQPSFRHRNLDSGSATIAISTNDGASATGIPISSTPTQTAVAFPDATGVADTGWTQAQVDALEMTLEYE